jgi:hypothetical protein
VGCEISKEETLFNINSLYALMAEEAVCCEPVSAGYSLVSAKNTANFFDSGQFRGFWWQFIGQNQWLTVKFPTDPISEFKKSEQRLHSEKQRPPVRDFEISSPAPTRLPRSTSTVRIARRNVLPHTLRGSAASSRSTATPGSSGGPHAATSYLPPVERTPGANSTRCTTRPALRSLPRRSAGSQNSTRSKPRSAVALPSKPAGSQRQRTAGDQRLEAVAGEGALAHPRPQRSGRSDPLCPRALERGSAQMTSVTFSWPPR